jgi:PhzF family phenazine biosynthesis protein
MGNATVIYQVDAFTQHAFKGNPAGVMLVDDTTSEEWMQSMAAEMNLSETAFLFPQGKDYAIRFFTPTVEIPLCGHATLASAHILYELGLKKSDETILFHAKGGTLNVSKEGDGIVMNFPAYPIQKVTLEKDFLSLLGFTPIDVYSSLYDWIIVVAATEKEIAEANPNFDALIQNGLGHLMITAQGDTFDFVVRCFAPQAGINEDPVTGSAQCALVPIWQERTGLSSFHVLQNSKRTGILNVKALNDRVEIKGQSITVFKATLMI